MGKEKPGMITMVRVGVGESHKDAEMRGKAEDTNVSMDSSSNLMPLQDCLF